MNKSLFTISSIAILSMIVTIQSYADGGAASTQQEDLNKVLEMMKSQGLDEKSMKQMEYMLQGMQVQATEQDAAKLEREKNEFEKTWAKNGNARVEVQGKIYALKVTTCRLDNLPDFRIDAQQAPGSDDGKLWAMGKRVYIGADEFEYHTEFKFSTATESYRPVIDPALGFDGKKVEWEGRVASKNGSGVQIKFNLELPCGTS
jgi:hypothetical protein